MAKQSVSVLISSEKVSQLDLLASNQDRDRSFVVNEAIDMYLDLQRHHQELIKRGLADIKAGNVVSHEEVGRRIAERRQRVVTGHK